MSLLDADGTPLKPVNAPVQSPTKIVFCLPTRGECKSGFSLDLARLVNFTVRHRPDLSIGFMTAGGLLMHDLRALIARQALEAGADYLFWLDDDMRFPPHALLRLLGHQKDIVGCNYITRNMPPRPTARNMDPNGVDFWAVPSAPDAEGLEEVDALGFGCLLMHARVFEKLDQPWFSMPYSPQKGSHVGEDVYFCINASKAGFSTYLDHGLSRELRHVGSFEWRWEHFDADEEIRQEQEASNGGES